MDFRCNYHANLQTKLINALKLYPIVVQRGITVDLFNYGDLVLDHRF